MKLIIFYVTLGLLIGSIPLITMISYLVIPEGFTEYNIMIIIVVILSFGVPFGLHMIGIKYYDWSRNNSNQIKVDEQNRKESELILKRYELMPDLITEKTGGKAE